MLRSTMAAFMILACVDSAGATENEDNGRLQVVLTARDHGRTIEMQEGQGIEVRLTNSKPGAGWEPGGTEIRGESVALANPKRKGNCDEFQPEDKSDQKTTIGVYVFRYVAKLPGTSELRLTHLYPSGPEPMPRKATQFIAELKVTVKVADK